MVSLPIYLISRFVYRIREFLEHWYWGSFRVASEILFGLLGRLDRFFAIKITLRHFFEPLYQDRTVIGYIFGFIFRSLRVAVAAFVYLAVGAVVIGLHLFWLSIPLYCLYRLVTSL
jgi:hypothetical protein